MTEIVKAIIIVSNHFKELPVCPKIIYANRYLLDLIGASLENVINKDPSLFFLNWNNDAFIQEIVQCVDQKMSWHGNLEFKDNAHNEIQKAEFTITPVYNVTGEICYYSCTTHIERNVLKSIDDNLVCLDDFVCALWEYHEHFREICELSPANLLKISNDGDVTYANLHALNQFGIKNGDNLFDLITNDLDRIQTAQYFTDKITVGKVSKIDFDIKVNNKEFNIHSKFWPIADMHDKIIGYSISISDITKNKTIAKQILALRGSA